MEQIFLVTKETDKAVLLSFDVVRSWNPETGEPEEMTPETLWVPKSQMEKGFPKAWVLEQRGMKYVRGMVAFPAVLKK